MTPDLLRAATGCTAALADRYAVPLADACQRYAINTPARLAAFLAQIGHESGGLQFTREIAGGQAYEGRADLGNTEPGDGPRFRGRGLLQVTGRSNYAAVSQALGVDFVAQPALLEQPTFAALSAAHWWHAHGCNAFADAGEFDKLSRLINRGNAFATKPANGEADRRIRWERARAALAKFEPPETEPLDIPTIPDDMPAGEAPDWKPPQKEPTMGPFAAAALSAVLGAAPELIDMFKGGSKSATRNSEAAKVVVNVAKEAIGASNEQDLIEKLADPATAATVRQAVRDRMVEIMEAGGGGIGGARAFVAEAASGPQGDRMWSILTVVTYAALGFLLMANVIASAAWGVAIWRDQNIESATQFLAQVITADIGATMTALGFWLGSSFGSRQKDERAQS